MKIFRKNLKKIITSTAIASILFGQLAIAAPLPALFYTSTFQASVGDTITFDLKVNPDASKPAYTVGATLKYDPTLLSFQSASVANMWLPLSGSPYELTDTTNGILTRTARYPTGLAGVANFTHYSFKAIKPGETKVVISEGVALDVENNDAGLQQKTITVRIVRKEASTTPTTSSEPAKKTVQQTITLGVVGSTAAYATEDYNFSIAHNLKVEQVTTGTTSVSILDQNGSEFYKTEKNFNTSTNTSLAFIIPSGTLQPGDYSLVITTKHSDQKTPLTFTKPLGVLAKTDIVIEKAVPTAYIPLYVYGMFAILLLIILLMYIHKRSRKFRNFIKNF